MLVDYRKMTTYGTIPTESPASSDLPIFIRAKEHIQSTLGNRRPWDEMIQFHSFNLPTSLCHFIERIRLNAALFRMNYAIIVLFILFVSLLWHPISLIVFIVMMVAWLYPYFLRDGPLIVFGYVIDDCMLMMSLSLATIAVLFVTDVTRNIIVGLSIGMVVILFHGALRSSDDLISVDDQQGLRSTAPLKKAACSSSNSS